jgi:hypothetical protein
MIDIIADFDDPELWGPWFQGPSWDTWRAVLRAAFGQPLTEQEREVFRAVAGDREPPEKRVEELWVIAGRRAGKDSIASFLASQIAVSGEYEGILRPGEKATVLCLASTKDQASIVLNYCKAYFEKSQHLAAMVVRETADGFELDNGAEIIVAPNSYKSVRGRTYCCAIFDETSFWRDETSVNPDTEVYNAVLPGLSTLPGSMLIGISTPYRKSGLLYEKWQHHFGKDDDALLVIRAASRQLNPTLDQGRIAAALLKDKEAQAAEWLAEWRADLADYVDRQVVEDLVVKDRRELLPEPGVYYEAVCDPSGGSSDSFTLAIAHRDAHGRGVLNCVREAVPPFSPARVISEYAALLRTYRISRVYGDRYAGLFPRELFQQHGIVYEPLEQSKSDIYVQALPLLNSGKAQLLDHQRVVSQICALERRVMRGTGRDVVDHPSGGKDDLANCVLAVLLRVAGGPHGVFVSDAALAAARSYRERMPEATWANARSHRRMAVFW